VSEYRSGDQTLGYCPLCFGELSNLMRDGRGFCRDGHGWVAAEWSRPAELDSDDEGEDDE
jgi:hypothetical protein